MPLALIALRRPRKPCATDVSCMANATQQVGLDVVAEALRIPLATPLVKIFDADVAERFDRLASRRKVRERRRQIWRHAFHRASFQHARDVGAAARRALHFRDLPALAFGDSSRSSAIAALRSLRSTPVSGAPWRSSSNRVDEQWRSSRSISAFRSSHRCA